MDDDIDVDMEEEEAFVALYAYITQMHMMWAMMFAFFIYLLQAYEDRQATTRHRVSYQVRKQIANINRLVRESDITCLEQLRMDRRCFMRLCTLVQGKGVSHSRHVSLEEKVAMFLNVLAHHTKNRNGKHDFFRSGQTMSRYFNEVLKGVLRLEGDLLVKPEPITADCIDPRWSCFQNCIGALDGTYVPVRPPSTHTARYRTWKGEIATNVLGVCNQNMNFIYVLTGWEGSAADGRVLRDAISRRNGLRIPTGFYYLVDGGYTNGQGFLAPYKGQRYHMAAWRDGAVPTTCQEYFNMKHAQARNVIEQTFGLLKMRWAILRSASYFPIRTQGRIITCCMLLHNFIRREMAVDPIENLDDEDDTTSEDPPYMGNEFIDVETSNELTNWRDEIAMQMWNAHIGVGINN